MSSYLVNPTSLTLSYTIVKTFNIGTGLYEDLSASYNGIFTISTTSINIFPPTNGADLALSRFYLLIQSFSCVKINSALVTINSNIDNRLAEAYIPFDVELINCNVQIAS